MKNIVIFSFKRLIVIFGLLVLASCASPKIEDYANEKPLLNLSEYFNGTVKGYGIFTDRSGQVVKRFTVDIVSTWQMRDGIKTGVLDESFVYSDGTTQKRIWTLKEIRPNYFEGSAADVVGIALGQAKGNALHWNYTLLLPVDGREIEVKMNDWMYLITPRIMLNRTQMTKFGFYLGEVTLSFEKI